ncbi:MAG: GDSL-type esterase/lipase family protein [Candidatus Zixiibacteriota bacterium]|jgi:hypothetical protein
MKPIVVVILVVSIIGNLIGAYIFYKALKLREEVKMFQRYHQDLKEKYEETKADFPGLSVYAEDNKRLLNSTTPEERKQMTVMYGASITKYFDPEKFLPGKKVINRGIGSQVGYQLVTRFHSDVLQLGPGQVVLKLCSGNFYPEYSLDENWDLYEAMILMAQSHGIKPLLATVIPVTRSGERFENYSVTAKIVEFNNRIKDYARKNKLQVIDYYGAMADNDGFLPDSLARDQIHPNDKGCVVMANALTPALN